MKILFVNKFLYPNGGSETYIFELGKALKKMGHEVQYFGMEHEGRIVGNNLNIYTKDMEFHADENAFSVSKLLGKLKKLTYPFKIIYSKEAERKITAVLKDFEPDVVHFNNINFQLTPSVIEAVADFDRKYSKDTKIVATAHDYQWVCPNHMMKIPSSGKVCFECEGGRFGNCTKNRCIHGSKLRSILGTIEAYLYKLRGTYGLVDYVICPSFFIKEKLETNPELKGKCEAIHNFMVSAETDNNENYLVSDISEKIHPNEYVLYFGRFSEEKGIKTLIDVCKRLPDIQFVFAGNGPLTDEVNQVNNIVNVGFLRGSKLQSLIKNAKFTVYPSEWYENCPFSVMESEQFETPIIASNIGGIPELIELGDKEASKASGELFEAGNADDLEKHIKALYENSERLAGYKEGCKNIHFDSIEEYCEKLLKLYK